MLAVWVSSFSLECAGVLFEFVNVALFGDVSKVIMAESFSYIWKASVCNVRFYVNTHGDWFGVNAYFM